MFPSVLQYKMFKFTTAIIKFVQILETGNLNAFYTFSQRCLELFCWIVWGYSL